eukprot:1682528-Prorocentrum_lima.AAC.1
MTSSLVGSEMCIRDRDLTGPLATGLRRHSYLLIMTHRLKRGEESILIPWAVSYTHLTLPTICSV